jgi:exosortase/archaeosortase family protein
LPRLGVPAAQRGFTLKLPTGQLNVVDACSGALSLTSLVAISVLTAYVRLSMRRDLTPGRAVALVGLTLPIVVVSNTVRVILTGVLAYYVGGWAIEGVWHEALGYLVILVGFGLIVGVSQKLAHVQRSETDRPAGLISDSRPLTSVLYPLSSGLLAVALLAPAAAACLWAEQFRQSHLDVVDLRAVAAELPGWQAAEQPVPPDVEETLKCDQMVRRVYEDHLGRSVEVYLMFWATPASTAHIHHPDVCWPSRGCKLAAGHVRPVRYATGREPLGVSVRHYDEPDGVREVVLYWTQNGAAVLPDGQEPAAEVSEYGWVADMLRGRPAPQQVSRLSVLLAAPVPVGRPADQEGRMETLAGLIAADLYRTCPWAAPPR